MSRNVTPDQVLDIVLAAMLCERDGLVERLAEALTKEQLAALVVASLQREVKERKDG